MTGVWEIAGSAFGAVATLAGVVAGGRLGSRAQERQWGRDACRDACADVLRGYVEVHRYFSRWARTGVQEEFDWSEWNRALGLVRLVAPPEVAAAADAMDAELWVISHALRGGRHGMDAWLPLREQLEARHLAFLNAARAGLLPGNRPLARAVGRPPADHPIWQLPAPRPE
ncbi:hypothetical protein [Kitasatospora terrestris]|uniref:Secreted protein n=1 Tax=Kitasatospora terrestris TaxID=258051 RepID=A0ABP9EGQ8_9ACTN